MSTIIAEERRERRVQSPERCSASSALNSGHSTLDTVPFPHRVIDDWAEPELIRAAEAEWPDDRWPFWHRYDNGKLATKDPLRFPPACAELVKRLLCLPIADLLGVEGTFGDWNCHGGGLHALPPGGNLGLHLDSDHHPLTGWKRAANAVLYLNERWEPDWGGELELYDACRDHCVKRIAPRAGRLALFVPGDAAWHAVAPVSPAAQTRKTLAVFFWTQAHTDADRTTRPRAQFVR